MLLSKVCAALLVLIARTCRADIIMPSENWDEALAIEAAVNILTSCYNNTYRSQEDAVGVVGNWPETFLPKLWSEMLVPVILIDTTKPVNLSTKPVTPHKLSVFVQSASSVKQFGNDLTKLRIFWWDNMASFIFVLPTSECHLIYSYLAAITTMGMLNVYFICVDRRGQQLAYTFNSYSSYAPKPWNFVGVTPSEVNSRPVAIFVRRYVEGESICEQWDFDKTKNMEDYEIPISAQILPENKYIKEPINSNAYRDVTAHILNNMYRCWNITWLMVNQTGSIEEVLFAFMFPNKTSHLPMILANPSHLWTSRKIVKSYPFSSTGLVVMTNFRGHKSQLEKILCVVDKNSRIGLGLVLLLTLLFLKFFVGQSTISAFLNVIRIICNTGFERLPSNTVTRLYMTALLFFAVTMQGIYQGNLASLLTHHVPVRNIDTMKDLAEMGGKIYGDSVYKHLFRDPVFESRYVSINYTDCVEFVLNDPLAACLNYPHVLMDQAKTLGLHLTVEYIIPIEEVFILSPIFPLKDKFDLLLLRMVEADIIRPLHLRVKQNTLEDFRFDKEVMSDEHHKAISFAELAFAFVILAVGLVCSLIAFVAEVVFFRFQNRKVHVRVQNLNLRQIRVAEKPERISV